MSKHADNPDALVVLTNMPDSQSAAKLAHALVEQKLAACVNVLSPCQSFYHWQGKLEHTAETPMMIKTTQAQYQALQTAILAAHPYELPEIIALHIHDGYKPYLQWLNAQKI
jgi:periplasmic divalent cation tolerance protein